MTEDGQSRSRHGIELCVAVVGLLIVAMTVSLATRTFGSPVLRATSVECKNSPGMRQHMDKDAARWAVPVHSFTILEAADFHPQVVPAGPSIPSHFLDERLYTRPPPSC